MQHAGAQLVHTHDAPLVLLSVFVAGAGSYAALYLVGQVTLAGGRARALWLLGGVLALGVGIWAMHFVSMLALEFPVPFSWDLPAVAVSLAVSVVGSGAGLAVAARRLPLRGAALAAGCLFVSFAIVGMHFSGMAAMRIAAVPSYDPLLTALSAAVAVAFSGAGLWLALRAGSPGGRLSGEAARRGGGAAMLAGGIVGMHYLAMAGTRFLPAGGGTDRAAAAGNATLAWFVGGGALAVFALALLGTAHGRRLSAGLAEVRALRESERRSRALAEAAPDFTSILEADGTVRHVSPSIGRVLGYRPEERLGRSTFELVHPDDREAVRRALSEGAAEGEPRGRLEHRHRHKDGSWRWLETVGVNLLSDPGVGGVVATSRDVTERRRAEDRLREAEERYRALVEQTPAVTYVQEVRRGHTVSYVSPQVERMTGHAPEAYDADPGLWCAVVHPDDRGRLLAEDENADENADETREDFSTEYRLVHRDGRTVWVRDEATLVGGGEGRPAYWHGVMLDVTERKRAEGALRESEERFRSLAQNSSDVITVLEPDGRIRYESPAIERILGWRAAELVGESAFDLVHPDDRGRALDVLLRAVASGEDLAEPIEVRFRHADGSWRWLEVVGNNLISDPAVGGAVLNSRDVTERKAHEEALRQSEERYRAVVEQAAEGIVLVDADERRLVEANPEFGRMFGYAAEEAVGLSLYDLVAHDPGSVDRNMELVLREGSRAVGERRFRRKDGTPVDVMTSGSAVEYGGRRVVCIVIRDITERKRAEEALREAEAKYRALVENIPAVVYVDDVDETNSVIYRSPHVREVLGYEPEEFLSHPEFWQSLLHPDDRERVLAENERTNATGEPFGIEYRMIRKDGRHVWLRDEAVLIRDEDGTPKFWQGYFADITARKEAEVGLREAEARYRSLVEQIPVATYTQAVEHGGAISYASPQIRDIVGYTAEEWVADPGLWVRTLHPDDRGRVLAEDARTDETGEPYRVEHRRFRKDGSVVWVRNEAVLVRDGEGRPLLWQGVVSDITERKEAEEALKKSEERFRALVQNASDVILILDPDGSVRYVSPAVERVLGDPPEERVGRDAFGADTHPDDAAVMRGVFAEGLGRPGGMSPPLEFRARHRDGSWRHLQAVAANRLDHPAVRGIVVNARDVTERRAYEERLEHQALHDPLTGLPNRALLMDRLSRTLSRAERRGGRDGRQEVAVLFVDLDNFKYVNDSLGHEAGDRLLVEAAERLERVLRPSDTAARLGGDEFAVLLEDVRGEGEAARVARRVTEAFSGPFAVGGPAREAFVTASVGVALSRGPTGHGAAAEPAAEPAAGAADLLRRADLAMYEAKAGGKARHAVFDPESERRSLRRLGLENGLRRALERDEFVVLFQPVVALDTGRTVGFEALVRWEHPERGLVPPDEFVPLAEELGLTVPMGRLVLREACRRAREWQGLRPGNADAPPVVVGVNLSGRQLSHPGLVVEVGEILRESGLDPACLTLEITEGAVVGDGGRHVDVLRRLRALGVRLALDDFGTGYSSLSHLRRLPVGMLKVDRSFVQRVGGARGEGDEAPDEVLLSGILGIARGLGMRALAEGVETPEQAARLRELGCDLAQGFLFSRPLTAEAATEFLRARDAGGRPDAGPGVAGTAPGPPPPPDRGPPRR